MTAWTSRSPEERALLNPSYFSVILWHAATGHRTEANASLPFDTAFLVLPLVLHRETRDALPKSVVTSLPVWLDENPLVRARLAERARALVPYTKEALMFGGTRGLLSFTRDGVTAERALKPNITSELKRSNDEIRSCVKKADFVGRWFARTGNAATVMSLLGVRP